MKIQTLSDASNENYEEVHAALASGKVVVFPTDTVYGLLVDARNQEAIDRLIAIKKRAPGKPIAVFVKDWDMLKNLVEVSIDQEKLLRQILPGRYTIVLPSKHTVCSSLESETGTLGVRLIEYKPLQDLIGHYGKPITATSANISGTANHSSLDSLIKSLPQSVQAKIELGIDAGKLPQHKPSTVIDYSKSTISILRLGEEMAGQAEEYLSNSEQATQNISQIILNNAYLEEKPVVILLKGEVGAGKTVFTKGLANLLKVKDVVSPTFVIYYEYLIAQNSRWNKLFHADLYAIQDPQEYKHLGIESYFSKKTLSVIEWGERLGSGFEELLKDLAVYTLIFEHTGANTRTLRFTKNK